MSVKYTMTPISTSSSVTSKRYRWRRLRRSADGLAAKTVRTVWIWMIAEY